MLGASQEEITDMPTKKLKTLHLVGLDGNAFNLLSHFQRAARREKWTPSEIKAVLDKAMSGDYDNLLATLCDYCENP